jgi:hypothetical protein
MALYLVRARQRNELLKNLHEKLSSGKISRMIMAALSNVSCSYLKYLLNS